MRKLQNTFAPIAAMIGRQLHIPLSVTSATPGPCSPTVTVTGAGLGRTDRSILPSICGSHRFQSNTTSSVQHSSALRSTSPTHFLVEGSKKLSPHSFSIILRSSVPNFLA